MSDPREMVTVVTAGREELILCWAAAWVKSGNKGWRVRIGDEGFSEETRAKLTGQGFELFDMKVEGLAAVAAFPGATRHHAMWGSKPSAMILGARTRWCFWLDHDAEVRGDISPIVEHGLSLGRWLSAPFYASMGPGRYAGKRVTQNGMALVDVCSPGIATWRRAMVQRREPNDETVLAKTFSKRGLGDLYRPEWYASCDCYEESRESLAKATERLKESGAVVRHWCAGVGKRTFKELYAEALDMMHQAVLLHDMKGGK